MILFGAYLYRQLSRRRRSSGVGASVSPGTPGLVRMLMEELLLLLKRLRR